MRRRLLSAACVCAALAWFGWQWHAAPGAPDGPLSDAVPPTPCADWRQGCPFTIGGVPARLVFIDPPSALAAVRIRIEGGPPRGEAPAPTLGAAMRGMTMPTAVFPLMPAPAGWQGRIVLPVCTERRSDWLFTVTDATGSARIGVTLPAFRQR